MDSKEFMSRINSIPKKESFTDEDLAVKHPFRTVIHRRVTCPSTGDDVSCTEHLGVARRDSEFTGFYRNGVFSISMDKHNGHRQGMSCSSSCYCHGHVRSGAIPLEILPERCFTVDQTNGVVIIQDRDYQLIKCFHRFVDGSETVTVEQALEQSGKNDECLIDGNFSLYFENTEHGFICLRHQTDQDQTNYQLFDENRQVRFSHPFFDREAWNKCDALFVKFPTYFMAVVIDGKNIEDEIIKKSEEHQKVIRALFQAFEWTDLSNLEKVNDLLEAAFLADDFSCVSDDQRNEMLIVLDDLASDMYGIDSEYYSDELRPLFVNVK
jgi:hypothetical protein